MIVRRAIALVLACSALSAGLAGSARADGGPPFASSVALAASVDAATTSCPPPGPCPPPPDYVQVTQDERVGMVATIEASGAPTGTPPATGTIDFADNGQPIATGVPVADGVTAIVFRAGEAGPHEITAHYSGDANYQPSDSSFRHNVTMLRRIGGTDRIDTSVLAADAAYPLGGAKAVVLARSDDYADALAGAPLAARKDGVLLLNPPDALDPEVADEIAFQLDPGGTVYLLGGPAAISPPVADELTGMGYTVVRIAGADRFDTAVRVARDAIADPKAFIVATGRNFPDALSGAAAAAKIDGAVLLTDGPTMPPVVAAYIGQHASVPRAALGGAAAAADPGAGQIVGTDRYDTALKVAKTFFPDWHTFGVANGNAFPDALSGAAHIANYDGPLLLIDGPWSPPQPMLDYIKARRPTNHGGIVYGGLAAVNDQAFMYIRVDVSESQAY